jgi:hypothetical protein
MPARGVSSLFIKSISVFSFLSYSFKKIFTWEQTVDGELHSLFGALDPHHGNACVSVIIYNITYQPLPLSYNLIASANGLHDHASRADHGMLSLFRKLVFSLQLSFLFPSIWSKLFGFSTMFNVPSQLSKLYLFCQFLL